MYRISGYSSDIDVVLFLDHEGFSNWEICQTSALQLQALTDWASDETFVKHRYNIEQHTTHE